MRAWTSLLNIRWKNSITYDVSVKQDQIKEQCRSIDSNFTFRTSSTVAPLDCIIVLHTPDINVPLAISLFLQPTYHLWIIKCALLMFHFIEAVLVTSSVTPRSWRRDSKIHRQHKLRRQRAVTVLLYHRSSMKLSSSILDLQLETEKSLLRRIRKLSAMGILRQYGKFAARNFSEAEVATASCFVACTRSTPYHTRTPEHHEGSLSRDAAC
ncbi:hypothetical protein BCR43DRAFT_340861 [Syncephalastrum racemosum]|uniref:Uncharacterized protein n=1 Tax=Syncephalastrum racemosum TaxID=13706 RepID=A0A1X2H8Z3_SYNRA|nr:hypothetical protein BCR43DRAFT_340861 [Syncephalastrum racemosum]